MQCLEDDMSEHPFDGPSEESLAMLDSFSRSKKIKPILTRHQHEASFMAATYGLQADQRRVCMTTHGPHTINFVTAAA